MNTGKSKVFEDVLYAQCWEDPQLDRAAFAIRPGDTVFSITSGGCNVLAFLIDSPARIIAADLNPFQNYLLEIKMAAFRLLDYDQLLEFFGVRDSALRAHLYKKVRPALGPESLLYWDGQREKILGGIIHCGRYESYMRLVGRAVERLMGRRLVNAFFSTEDEGERARIFQQHWKNLRWWILTRVLLSKTTMSLLFDRGFFRYLDGSFSFGRHFAEMAEQALIHLSPAENPYLSYILLGRYASEDFLPLYLRPENFGAIKDRLDRIEITCEDCESCFARLPDSSVSQFNFTNIFEWMSEDAFERLLRETYRVGMNGAVLTYRNLLVRRECPPSLTQMFRSRCDEARVLHARDLSFVYSRYVIEEVVKGDTSWSTECGKFAIAAQ